jgi:uncharacterized integral membrane protein (TIGR00698 family)
MIPSPAWFLFAGIVIALTGLFDRPRLQNTVKSLSGTLLKAAVVLSGARVSFQDIITHSTSGALLTAVSVSLVMALGWLLARLFRRINQAPFGSAFGSPDQELNLLISSGTAICGGSAIAAVGPSIGAKTENVGIAIAVVFVLNALGLFLFPVLGQIFALDDRQFAYWAALAIHDTSSVVGAAAAWSETALNMATTLKLTRALWIIPLALVLSQLAHKKAKFSVPWFILGFIAMSLVGSYGYSIPLANILSQLGFSLSLFLIGLSFSKSQLARVGLRPLIFGVTLWILTATGSLFYVRFLML